MDVAGRGLLFVPATYPERLAEAEASGAGNVTVALAILDAQPGASREVGHDL